MSRQTFTLFDPALAVPAFADAWRKLNPAIQWRNPVMFVVAVVSALTTVLLTALGVSATLQDASHWAFAAGPALIVVLALILKRVANFDAGKEAINKMVTIIIYAAIANMFFLSLEFPLS